MNILLISFFCGICLSISPLISGMYAPALPQLTDYFHADVSQIQLTVTFSVLGLAFGQFFLGPLSDKYGRKELLLVTLFLFLLSTLICPFLTSVNTFIIMRFIQGFVAAGALVSSRSIATDLLGPAKIMTGMAIIGAVNSSNKILFPLLSGKILQYTDWKFIFYFTVAVAVMLIIFTLNLKEIKKIKKKTLSFSELFKKMFLLLKNKAFFRFVLAFSLIQAIQYSYVTATPFVFQKIYNFTPFDFSLFFAISAAIFGLGSLFPAKIDPKKGFYFSKIGLSLSIFLLLFFSYQRANVCFYLACWLFVRFFMGMSYTIYMAQAMNAGKEFSGSASAVLGLIAYSFGAIFSLFTSLGNNIQMMTAILLFIAVFLLNFLVYKYREIS